MDLISVAKTPCEHRFAPLNGGFVEYSRSCRAVASFGALSKHQEDVTVRALALQLSVTALGGHQPGFSIIQAASRGRPSEGQDPKRKQLHCWAVRGAPGRSPHSLCGQRDRLGHNSRLQLRDQLQLPLATLDLRKQHKPKQTAAGQGLGATRARGQSYLPCPQAKGSHRNEEQEPLEKGVVLCFCGRRFCCRAAAPAGPPGQT